MRNRNSVTNRPSRVLRAVAAGAVAAMLGASSASGSQFLNNFGNGYDPIFDAGDDLWSNPNNWNNGIPGAPFSGAVAWINVTSAHFPEPPKTGGGPATINYAAPTPAEIVVGQDGGHGWVLMTEGGSISTPTLTMAWGNERNGIWDQDGGTTTITGNVEAGRPGGGTATLNISGGTFAVGGQFFLGHTNQASVANISGGTVSATGNIRVAARDNTGTATGALNISGGTVSTGGQLIVGRGDSNASGSVTISGTADVTTSQPVRIGTDGGSGGTGTNSLTVSGGTLTVGGLHANGMQGTQNIEIGHVGGDASMHISGGTVYSASVLVANLITSTAQGTLTVDGGALRALQIGVGASSGTGANAGHFIIGGDAHVETVNHIFLRPDGRGTMTVNGSDATIMINRTAATPTNQTGFEVTNGSVVNFNADANGISTVKLPLAGMRFSGPDGILNVDATDFEKVRRVDLFQFAGYYTGSGATGITTFGTENIQTSDGFTGTVVYHADRIEFRHEWWLPGDANLSSSVTIADLGILAANWQQTDRFWEHGDFNFDGVVNIADLGILAGNWQAGTGGGMSFQEALAMFDVFEGVVVPEPAAAGLLGMAGLMALRRRRR
jgi:hypothetical protein